MKILIIFSILIGLNEVRNLPQCILPRGCRIQQVNNVVNPFGNDKAVANSKKGLKCDIFQGFQFDFNQSLAKDSNGSIICDLDIDKNDPRFEMRWPNRDEETSILDENFNFLKIYVLAKAMKIKSATLNLINVKGFEIFKNSRYLHKYMDKIAIEKIYCISCKIKFYIRKSPVKSCQDIIEANITYIQAIFQIYPKYNKPITRIGYIEMNLIDNDFGKYPLCPLVFNNSRISILTIKGLLNSFYKTNVLTFSNTTHFYSDIQSLELNNVQNIDLDHKLLNKFVFKDLQTIYVIGYIKIIEGSIFKKFKKLWLISFKTINFRSMMHRNGINWIKSINDGVNMNISSFVEQVNLVKHINLECFFYSQDESMAKVFPDEDFCIYIDFPFDKLVLISQYCTITEFFHFMNNSIEFSCTYLWLTKYYQMYREAYFFQSYLYYYSNGNMEKIYLILENINRVLSDRKYNASLKKCKLRKMIQNCNKTKYKVKDIWSRFDYMILNTKLEISIRIASYVVSLLGIVTNLIVIITILAKKNTESFKDIKHYSYLWINSLFSALMLFIQVVSWMSECFYPYNVFCPEIRKLVVIQVFKMVFKECLIVAFRFMCNFTYIAFAFNRISLLDNNSSKLVKFMSDIGLKKYLAVTLFISCGLSSVKYFKYDINYDHSESSYPISNELDMTAIAWTKISNDAFIIVNSIVDLLNYVVFEIVNVIVDIYLVMTLRRTLNEKANKLKALYGKDSKKLESKENEFKDIVDKAIKMVILNTAISVLFKLPVSLIPVMNVYAEFYYKNIENQFYHPYFGYFYSFLLDSGFYKMIIHLSDFFFTFSLFIQLFIYIRFDKKFKASVKNLFSSSNTRNKNT